MSDLPPEIQAVLQQIAQGPVGDPDDPPLLYSRTTPNPDQFGPGVPLKVPQQKRVSQMTKDLFRMSRPEVRKLQSRLLAGGFYGQGVKESDLTGDQDDETVEALERAAVRAARFLDAGEDVTFDEVLERSSHGRTAESLGLRKPFSATVTNPADIIATIEKMYQAEAGRKPPPEVMAGLVAAYQQQQIAAQRQAYAMNDSGGVVADPPSLPAFASAEAQKADPTGTREMDLIELNDTVMGFLRSGGGD